jgi:hypothetical protein
MKRLTAYPALREHLDKLQSKVFVLSSDADVTPIEVKESELEIAADVAVERIKKSKFTSKGDKDKVISLYEEYARNTVGALTKTLGSLQMLASHSATAAPAEPLPQVDAPAASSLRLAEGQPLLLLSWQGSGSGPGSGPRFGVVDATGGRVAAAVTGKDEAELAYDRCSQAVLPWRPPAVGWDAAFVGDARALRDLAEPARRLAEDARRMESESALHIESESTLRAIGVRAREIADSATQGLLASQTIAQAAHEAGAAVRSCVDAAANEAAELFKLHARKGQEPGDQLEAALGKVRVAIGKVCEAIERLQPEAMVTAALRSSGASGARRYAAGQPLTVRTSGGWRDADVARSGADGLCHLLEFEGSGEPPATLTLHPWNHAPRELPHAAYEAMRDWWARSLRANHARIADALTGKRLDALQQCVAISVDAGVGGAALERQAALMSGPCGLSLREVDWSAQAIEATETATLQRLALLFAPELKVPSATLGDGGRSVRLEKSDGRALLGAVSPMVELVVQQDFSSSGGCYIGAALPDKGALSCYLGEDAGSWGYRADGVIKHKGSRVQDGLPTYKAGDRIRMTLAGGVLAWHINGQRAAEVRGVPSGVHFGVSRFDSGTVEVRIERASVAGAVGCSAMLRPLCALMGREGNALRTVRLGGNGAWAEGDGSTLAAALGAASCVVAELDVSGSGLGADEAVALVSAGRALQTLRLGEWVIPVGELRSGESVSTGGQAVGEAEGAVVGALLKASTSLTTLDLSGSSCAPGALARILEGLRASAAPLAELRLGGQAVSEAEGAVVGALLKASTSLSTLDLSGSSCAAEVARLIGEGLRESAAPLAELRLANVLYTTDGRMPFEAVLERQAALMSGACRLSLREVDCSAQAIEATETATLQRLALLFAPELMVASATLGDGGRSVRLEKSDGRALLGAVSPMVELVMQECTSSGGCYIGAALPDKGALSCYLGEDAGSWGYRADGVIKHKGFRVQSGLPTYKAGDRIRMTLAGGVLAWHINGQRAAEVRGVPSGVHFGVSRFDSGTVEVRIERASVAGAVGCSAMLRPLCALMGREGNALRTVRLGGNGAWAEGDGSTLAAALGAASCVVAELDVSGSGLGADEAVALVSAGCALQTLRLGEWAIPVGELRSGESMSTIGQAVGEAEGAVVGALLKASTSLSTLDLIAPASARRTGAHLDLVDPTSGAAPAGGGFGAAPSPFGGSAAAAPAFGAVTMPEVGTSSPYGATLAFGGVIAASAPSAGGGGFGGAAVAPGTEATAIRDAHSLTAWLLAQHGAQLEGGPTEGPLAALLTAGPASGKTTLLSQVVMIALLDERTELVPILVKVQVLQRRLLEAPDAFAGAWNFIDAFLRLEHEASRPALYRMLRQAMMARRALLLLDGLDEAGTKRDDIERHVVDVLAPQGHVLLCTSRPAGVDEARFAAFRRLALAPLSDEQQERALEQRLGAERAAALLTYVRDVMPRDDTGQKVTSNPLMLSMVASVYELRQGVGMPATVAELYATASDAMLARGGVATPELTRLLQRIFFEAHVAQRRLIEDRQLDEAALGLEAPEALAKIRAEAAMMPFEPFNGRAEMGHYVEVTKEGEHKGRRGVITTDQESRHVYYQVTFANGTVSGWLKPNELRSSGLVGEVAALQRAMDASALAVRAECETRLSMWRCARRCARCASACSSTHCRCSAYGSPSRCSCSRRTSPSKSTLLRSRSATRAPSSRACHRGSGPCGGRTR